MARTGLNPAAELQGTPAGDGRGTHGGRAPLLDAPALEAAAWRYDTGGNAANYHDGSLRVPGMTRDAYDDVYEVGGDALRNAAKPGLFGANGGADEGGGEPRDEANATSERGRFSARVRQDAGG